MTKNSNHNEEESISFRYNQNTKIRFENAHEDEFAENDTSSADYYFDSYSHLGLGLAPDMATSEPLQRKRKIETTVEEIFPMAEKGKTLYLLEEGTYLPEKNGGGGYASPPASSSDDDVDPILEAEYYRQIRESEGSNIKLLRLVKYNYRFTGICTFYITADAMDPATNSRFAFQTCVSRWAPAKGIGRIETEICRIKPETQVDGSEDKKKKKACHWNYEAIDDFYKGELRWLPDDALVQSSDKQQQYYEVQDSEIQENDWLNLYAEYAFFPLLEKGLTKLKFGVPLEIKKVVVQTCEAIESKEKLKAKNAIFYISYMDCGLTEEHRAVVRRTTDGLPEHFCIEVKWCLVS